MPEGDTIFRTARTLHRALAGRAVTRFQSGLAPLADVDRRAPVAGRLVERVAAAGKHCLVWFSGSLVLRTHMRMNGSWHIYRPGERWQRPATRMRILIETADWLAVAFDVYSAEFVREEALADHRAIASLGPDLLGEVERDLVLARVAAQGARPAHEVLLDQRVMAGLGNVYKSELLFLSAIHPDRPADAIDGDAWWDLITRAQALLRVNVDATARGPRRTTGRLNTSERLWVYGRGGRPCRRCGTPIASRKDGDAARVTYWCPTCQRM